VYAVVYGTEGQVAAVRRSVNRAHAPVRRKPDAGSAGYSAFDAHSQLWVVATLYDTAVTVYERIYGALDDEAAEQADEVSVRVARELLYPPDPQLWQRLVMPLARFITVGLLPDQLRQGFGLPWSERHRRWFDRTVRWSAVVYPRLPQRARHWPKNYCLARLGTA